MWILEKLQLNAASRPPIERGRDAPPIVPFEVFQKMFEEYSSSSSSSLAGEANRVRAGPGSDGHESRDSYTSLEAPAVNGDGNDGGVDGVDLDIAMNAVQHLAKEDKLFDSFLKMSLRDKPVGRVSHRQSNRWMAPVLSIYSQMRLIDLFR